MFQTRIPWILWHVSSCRQKTCLTPLSAIQGEGGDRPSVTSSQQLLSSIQGSKACLNVFDGKPMTIWPEHASRYTILDVRGQHTPTKAYDKMQLNDYHATPAYLLLQNSENVSNASHPKTRETNGLRWLRVPGCSQYCWRPHSCNAIHATFPSTSILLFSIQRPHRTAAKWTCKPVNLYSENVNFDRIRPNLLICHPQSKANIIVDASMSPPPSCVCVCLSTAAHR